MLSLWWALGRGTQQAACDAPGSSIEGVDGSGPSGGPPHTLEPLPPLCFSYTQDRLKARLTSQSGCVTAGNGDWQARRSVALPFASAQLSAGSRLWSAAVLLRSDPGVGCPPPSDRCCPFALGLLVPVTSLVLGSAFLVCLNRTQSSHRRTLTADTPLPLCASSSWLR